MVNEEWSGRRGQARASVDPLPFFFGSTVSADWRPNDAPRTRGGVCTRLALRIRRTLLLISTVLVPTSLASALSVAPNQCPSLQRLMTTVVALLLPHWLLLPPPPLLLATRCWQ